MKNITPENLAKELRNIGPISARQLISVGIHSLEELKKVGAVEAYLRIYDHGGYSCLNAAYLYALEGAIRDCDWRDIPDTKKEEFKVLTASLRAQVRV